MLPKSIRRRLLKRKLRKLWDKAGLETVKSRISSIYPKDFPFHKCGSCGDYLRMFQKKEVSEGIFEELIIERQSEQTIWAHCAYCGETSPMKVDFLYASKQDDGKKIPNFRERMTCPKCGLNNRLRAIYHLMRELTPEFEKKNIYVTEELTPFFVRLREKNPNVIGSEYAEDDPGKKVYIKELDREVNNEDLTKLSFEDKSLDVVISCDVLEHVPDYKKALCEIWRVLNPEGYFIFTVPFIPSNSETLVRARIENGKINHILEAEYHGDPVNPEGGCLCFYHFGWDLVDVLKDVGFSEAGVYTFNSLKHAYLGQGITLCAKK